MLGNTAYTAPANIYVALFTATPSDTGGGTEVSGNNYSRVAKTNNTTNFPNATGTNPTSKSNGTQIAFPTPSGSWGTVSQWGIFDAATTGNLLYWGDLAVANAVVANNVVTIEVGDMVITES